MSISDFAVETVHHPLTCTLAAPDPESTAPSRCRCWPLAAPDGVFWMMMRVFFQRYFVRDYALSFDSAT